MIEVSHLSRNFGDFKAVDDISFSIPTGQIVGLLGPNGAGKSTTMRMISGFLRPSSGKIVIDGQDTELFRVETKRKIGYMPESAPLYGEMIVADYLRYVAQIQNQNPEEKVPILCAECGLKEVMHKNIAELSRGYRQRVGLAHALVNDPEILILDEPTSGLDPNQIGEVRELIKEIGKTRTVIISTHILGEVEIMCSRVIIISAGKISADSPTAELRKRYGTSASVFIQCGGCSSEELSAKLKKIKGVSSVEEEKSAEKIAGEQKQAAVLAGFGAEESFSKSEKEVRAEIFRAIKTEDWILYELSLRRNSLEDVFRLLTSESAESSSADEKTRANGKSSAQKKSASVSER